MVAWHEWLSALFALVAGLLLLAMHFVIVLSEDHIKAFNTSVENPTID
jgi:hypothetical protein